MADRKSKRKDDVEYNGWTNWATWNVHLWISNDEGMYRECVRQCRHYDARGMLDESRAEMIARELLGPTGTPDFDSPANWADVDWESILEAFREMIG